jgi:hypothetical protein
VKAKIAAILFWTVVFSIPAFAVLTRITGVQIVNSQIDGTPIGSLTPSTGKFSGLTVGTSNIMGGATGNSGSIQEAGTNSGVLGAPLCNDSNSNVTTTCPQSQSTTFCAAGCNQNGTPCTTGNSSYSQCGPQQINWPTNFSDTNYVVYCNGVGPNDLSNSPNNGRAYVQVNSKAQGSVSVISVTTGAAQINWTEIDCFGRHR